MAETHAVAGAGGGIHTYSAAEKRGYVDFINQDLKGDRDVGRLLPINTENDDFFGVVGDGVLFAKMMNKTFKDNIDEGKLVKKPKNMFEKNLNLDMCLAGAQKIGCSTVNVGATDLGAGTPHLVMGLTWQIIKACLMKQIMDMDTSRLTGDDSGLPPEQILLRWFNYHLKNAGHHRMVTNFSEDIADGECYAVLLSEIAKSDITPDMLEGAFRCASGLPRATRVLEWADKLGCRKFVTPQDIVDGNPRLNLGFVATLFQAFPCLGPTAEELARRKAAGLEEKLDDMELLLADTMAEKDALQEDLNKTRLDFDALSDDLNSLTLQLEQVTDERDEALGKVSSLEELLGATTQERDNLRDELNTTKQEKDDLFAQLEQELGFKLDLENELNATKDELDNVKRDMSAQIAELSDRLDTETSLRKELQDTLDQTLDELEALKLSSSETEADLMARLQAETDEKNRLQGLLDSTLDELEEARRLQKETEQTKEDLFKLLTDTISELEATKAAAAEREAELLAQLDEERRMKEEFSMKLREKTEEFEKALADWEEERARLLARIKELEDELEALKIEMRERLEEAELEKERALAAARAAMEQALNDAENEKDLALDKVRMLLTGNQRQGYLQIYQSGGVLGNQDWRRRYFVLRDNLLSWYKDEKRIDGKKAKPLGVIYCEEARLYEMEEKEVGRPLCFQIDTGKQRWNIACESLEDMRAWMTEIRVAKKKKLGVKVVSSETTVQRKAREQS